MATKAKAKVKKPKAKTKKKVMTKAKPKTKAKAKVKKKVKPQKKVVEKKKPTGKQIGRVSNYFKHVKAAAIKLTAPLKVGDKIRITGGDKDFEVKVKSMQVDREKITKAKKGDEIGLLVPKDVHDGYKVFLVK
jgi:hypothetical protein